VSPVSGIPKNWNKSDYNSRKRAIKAMRELLEVCVAKCAYVLISYNNEGIITQTDWDALLAPYAVERRSVRYDTFKGSRNLKDRNDKVIENMFLVSKMKN